MRGNLACRGDREGRAWLTKDTIAAHAAVPRFSFAKAIARPTLRWAGVALWGNHGLRKVPTLFSRCRCANLQTAEAWNRHELVALSAQLLLQHAVWMKMQPGGRDMQERAEVWNSEAIIIFDIAPAKSSGFQSARHQLRCCLLQGSAWQPTSLAVMWPPMIFLTTIFLQVAQRYQHSTR